MKVSRLSSPLTRCTSDSGPRSYSTLAVDNTRTFTEQLIHQGGHAHDSILSLRHGPALTMMRKLNEIRLTLSEGGRFLVCPALTWLLQFATRESATSVYSKSESKKTRTLWVKNVRSAYFDFPGIAPGGLNTPHEVDIMEPGAVRFMIDSCSTVRRIEAVVTVPKKKLLAVAEKR